MECGFEFCTQPESARECVICDGVLLNVCSNEALHARGVDFEQELWLCSYVCYTEYAESEGPHESETSDIESPTDVEEMQSRQLRRNYSFKEEREVLLTLESMTTCDVADVFGIPRRTIRNWQKKSTNIFSFKGSEKRKSLRPGRPESIPFSADLLMFMKDRCWLEQVCTATIILVIYLLIQYEPVALDNCAHDPVCQAQPWKLVSTATWLQSAHHSMHS